VHLERYAAKVLVLLQVHRLHKQFTFFKKKNLGIPSVRDGGSAI